MTKRRFYIFLAICLLTCWAAVLLAATTNYTQQFAGGHGWTYTEVSCSDACSGGDAAADGNPSPSVYINITGRNGTMVGYQSNSYTWEDLGVPSGNTVDTVDAQWDNKLYEVAVACKTSEAGMQIFDSANTTEITASAVEPLLDVTTETSSWVNHNPTGAIAVSAGYKVSTTTVTLRFNLHPASGNNKVAECEIRGDNYKLTIESTSPSTGQIIIISTLAPREGPPVVLSRKVSGR